MPWGSYRMRNVSTVSFGMSPGRAGDAARVDYRRGSLAECAHSRHGGTLMNMITKELLSNAGQNPASSEIA